MVEMFGGLVVLFVALCCLGKFVRHRSNRQVPW